MDTREKVKIKFKVLTLFPEILEAFKSHSIIKRAIEANKLEIELIDYRKYSINKHYKVDDTPYGGGSGMVLRCEPIFDCLDDIRTDDSYVILVCPTGKPYKQSTAKELTNKKHLIIICGHYEGFDERIKSLADEIVSLGDFILTGGEIPAMAITDSVIRLIDGVINNDSLNSESFNDNLLDYPVYTKPAEYRGMKVPEILLSGDHAKITKYRETERIRVTKESRPDLID